MAASRVLARWKGASLVPAAAGAGLLALTLVAYAPFLGSGFAATDSLPLVETSRLTSLADVVSQFSRPVMAGTRFVLGEVVYRPFVSFTFGLDYAVWGQNALGFHLTNLGLHLAGVLGVWALLSQLGLRWWSSLFGAALFALHPLGVASVPVVARRDSVLPVAAFAIGAALLLLAERATGARRWAALLGAAVLLAVALLSKESAFAAMGLLPMLLASRGLSRAEPARRVAGRLWVVVPFLVLAAIVFAIRLAVLGGMGGAPDDSTALTRIDWNKYSQTLGAYTRDLLWPFAWLAASTREIWPRLAAALVLGLALLLVWLPRRQAVLAAAGLGWIVGFGVFCVALKIGTIAWLGYFVLVGIALLAAAALEGSLLSLTNQAEDQATRAAGQPHPPDGSRLSADSARWWRGQGAYRRPAAGQVAAVVLLAGVAVLAASALWASPLVRDYYQWRVAGDVTSHYMQALRACVDRSARATSINLRGLPSDLDDEQVDTSLLGVTLFEDYTVEAGLRLALPGRSFAVHVASSEPLRNAADSLSLSCTPSDSGDGVDFTTTTTS